jgi:hypothetical protein
MNGEKKKTETLLDTSKEAELEKRHRKLRLSKNACSCDSTRMQDSIIKQARYTPCSKSKFKYFEPIVTNRIYT